MKLRDIILNEHGTVLSKNDAGNNPKVQVHGFGVVDLNTLKKEVQIRLEGLHNQAMKENWKFVKYYMEDSKDRPGVLASMVQAVIDAEAELEARREKAAQLAAKEPRLTRESPLRAGNSFNGAEVGDAQICPAPTQWEDFRKELVIAMSKTKAGVDPVWLKHLTVPHLDDEVSYPLVKAFEYSKDSVNRHVPKDDVKKASWTDFDEGLIMAALVNSFTKWYSNFKFGTASQEDKAKVKQAGSEAFRILSKGNSSSKN